MCPYSKFPFYSLKDFSSLINKLDEIDNSVIGSNDNTHTVQLVLREVNHDYFDDVLKCASESYCFETFEVLRALLFLIYFALPTCIHWHELRGEEAYKFRLFSETFHFKYCYSYR